MGILIRGRERGRDREAETDRDRERQIQTDRQPEANRQTDDTNRQTFEGTGAEVEFKLHEL